MCSTVSAQPVEKPFRLFATYAWIVSLCIRNELRRPILKNYLKYEDAFIKPINVDNNRNKESNLHSYLSNLIFVDFFREIFERKQWR